MTYTPDVIILTSADSGVRPMPPKYIVVHTSEPGPYARGKNPGTVASLLRFLANVDNQASYHAVVGREGDVGQSNTDEYAPWAAGYTANKDGLHICAMGWAAQPRDEWLTYGKQLEGIAKVIAAWSKSYGIPLTRIVGADLKAGKKGVTGHFDTAQAWRETDHTDPGVGFPFDDVISRAKKLLGTQPEAPVADPNKVKSLVDGKEYSRDQFIQFNDLHNWRVDKMLTAICKRDGLPYTTEALKQVR